MKPLPFLSAARLLGFVTAALLASTAAAHAQAPANDNFANRQVLPSQTSVTVAGTTINATQEAFEVAYSQGSAPGDSINETKTVWYDYTPPVSGNLYFVLQRSDAGQTYLLLFKGGETPSLAQLVNQGYLPGDSEGDTPAPDVAVTAGQEYTFSLGNTSFPADFTLILTLKPTAAGPTPTPAPPVATVTAKGNADRTTGTPGKFVFALSAAATSDVKLGYKTAGTAAVGTDYKMLPGSVTIPAGQTTATLKVKPRGETDAATVAVKLKLEAGDGYTVGGASSAKVKIIDGQ